MYFSKEEFEDAYQMWLVDPSTQCFCDEVHICQQCLEEELDERTEPEDNNSNSKIGKPIIIDTIKKRK
mgnify:CR=1 FL=1